MYSLLDNKQSTIAVYLYFSKAFGTVNHDILMSMLLHDGNCGDMQSWFKSYFSNMKQICLSQKLQFLHVKHYISCSSRIGIGPRTFSFVYQWHAQILMRSMRLFILLTILQFLHSTVTLTMFIPL